MVVPLPYDAALLREHAYYDTNLLEYVLTPVADSSQFHRISDKGLGLFTYSFDSEIIYPQNSYRAAQLFFLNMLIFMALSMLFFSHRRFIRRKLIQQSSLLGSPLILKSSSCTSFESDLEINRPSYDFHGGSSADELYSFEHTPDLINSPIHSDTEFDDIIKTPEGPERNYTTFSDMKHLNFAEVNL